MSTKTAFHLTLKTIIAFCTVTLLGYGLAGCGLANGNDSANPPTTIIPQANAVRGYAHGGQQPVSGSTIQLYAAGNSGYGSAFAYASGTSLLGSTVVKTDANGNFSIPPGSYTCPAATTEVYIVGSGGNPGLGSSSSNPNPNNPNLMLAAALGPCGNLSASTFININELTTVAYVWALSPFMQGPITIGAPATNQSGLSNAFQTALNLVNTSTGQVTGPGLPSGATLPVAKLNTLADILASCVNSSGGSAGDGSACGLLFSYTTVGSSVPADTISAGIAISRNPQQNVSKLNNLPGATSPFQPTLASAPNDFNLVVTYTAGSLSTPRALAADTAGNIWIANSGGGSVTEFNPNGAPVTNATGLAVGSMPSAVATDQSGNAWIANAGSGTVTMVAPGGASSTTYSVGSTPSAIGIDAFGNAFVANSGANSVSEINGPGGAVTSTSVSGASSPVALAINPK